MFDLLPEALHAGAGLGLGTEYLFNDADHSLVAVTESGGAGGAGGAPAGGASPASTLVGDAHGLQIDLIWDTSVTSSANWRSIESAFVSAAELYTTLFTNHDVINIAVGFGEIGGSALAPGALGESESFGYITDEPTVQGALTAADAGLVHAHLMSPTATAALQGLSGESFFLTAADAKALGLVDPTAGLDGFIGLTNTSPLSFGHGGSATAFDAVGIAAHEISEVMGRVGLEGASLGPFNNVFTPLDIFRYSAPGVPDITPSAGYFSLDNGAISLLPFNDPTNGGDAADWATSKLTRGDAFDAFSPPGPTHVSLVDLLTVAALGYQVGLH